MLGFLKKLLGLPSDAEKSAAKENLAPYKIDAPVTAAPVETKVVSEKAVVSVPEAAKKAPKVKKESKPRVKTIKMEHIKDVEPKAAKPRAPRKPKVQ